MGTFETRNHSHSTREVNDVHKKKSFVKQPQESKRADNNGPLSKPPQGFPNLGRTCYMSTWLSVLGRLQFSIHDPNLRQAITNPSRSNLIDLTRRLKINTQQDNDPSIFASSLYSFSKWADWSQFHLSLSHSSPDGTVYKTGENMMVIPIESISKINAGPFPPFDSGDGTMTSIQASNKFVVLRIDRFNARRNWSEKRVDLPEHIKVNGNLYVRRSVLRYDHKQKHHTVFHFGDFSSSSLQGFHVDDSFVSKCRYELTGTEVIWVYEQIGKSSYATVALQWSTLFPHHEVTKVHNNTAPRNEPIIIFHDDKFLTTVINEKGSYILSNDDEYPMPGIPATFYKVEKQGHQTTWWVAKRNSQPHTSTPPTVLLQPPNVNQPPQQSSTYQLQRVHASCQSSPPCNKDQETSPLRESRRPRTSDQATMTEIGFHHFAYSGHQPPTTKVSFHDMKHATTQTYVTPARLNTNASVARQISNETGTRHHAPLCPYDGHCVCVNIRQHQLQYSHTCTQQHPCPWLDNEYHCKVFVHETPTSRNTPVIVQDQIMRTPKKQISAPTLRSSTINIQNNFVMPQLGIRFAEGFDFPDSESTLSHQLPSLGYNKPLLLVQKQTSPPVLQITETSATLEENASSMREISSAILLNEPPKDTAHLPMNRPTTPLTETPSTDEISDSPLTQRLPSITLFAEPPHGGGRMSRSTTQIEALLVDEQSDIPSTHPTNFIMPPNDENVSQLPQVHATHPLPKTPLKRKRSTSPLTDGMFTISRPVERMLFGSMSDSPPFVQPDDSESFVDCANPNPLDPSRTPPRGGSTASQRQGWPPGGAGDIRCLYELDWEIAGGEHGTPPVQPEFDWWETTEGEDIYKSKSTDHPSTTTAPNHSSSESRPWEAKLLQAFESSPLKGHSNRLEHLEKPLLAETTPISQIKRKRSTSPLEDNGRTISRPSDRGLVQLPPTPVSKNRGNSTAATAHNVTITSVQKRKRSTSPLDDNGLQIPRPIERTTVANSQLEVSARADSDELIHPKRIVKKPCTGCGGFICTCDPKPTPVLKPLHDAIQIIINEVSSSTSEETAELLERLHDF
jgi:hypothetical protein